ncbi:MAG: hypothetical protein AAF805_11940, partial [Planctomycetota bacterium]
MNPPLKPAHSCARRSTRLLAACFALVAIESPAQRVSLIWNGDNEVGRTADENARRDALERMGFETRWDSPNNGQSWWTTYA